MIVEIKEACVCYIKIIDKILLLNRNFKPFGWCLVGGHIDKMMETPEQAIKREIFEELGISLPVTFVGKSQAENGTLVYIFRSDINTLPEITISSEHSAFMVTNYPVNSNVCLAGNTPEFIIVAENSNKYVSWHDKLPFGKYKNKTFIQIANINASYLLWLHRENIIDIGKLPSIDGLTQFEFINKQECAQRRTYAKSSYKQNIKDYSVQETGTRVENDGYYESVYVNGCLKEMHELDDEMGIFRTGFSKYYD